MTKDNSFPAMPLYVKDWLTGRATVRMTPEQKGAFVDLLAHAWLADPPCTLEDDDTLLAKISGLGRRWPTTGALVKNQFSTIEDGHLRNQKQWEVYTELLERKQRYQLGAAKTNAQRHASDTPSDTLASTESVASRVADEDAVVLTESQKSVKQVLEAFKSSPPHPGLAAKWISQLGSAAAVCEIVWKYPDKPVDYIAKCVTTAAKERANGTRRDAREGTGAPDGTAKPKFQRFKQETADEALARLRAEGKLPPLPETTH
jgi:uncharacterized protein YdaU (DUF1376 family)